MLINLRDLCNKYKFIPKGIIHIGAHKAEEIDSYNSLGIKKVVWIEGNPDLIEGIKNKLSNYKNQIVLNYLVSDVDDKEYNFNITNNGESSSILELEKHLVHHPHIFVSDKKSLVSKKADTIIKENNINIEDYNFLNLDIQGAELLALKGFSDNLKHIDYIYSEVNTADVYSGCAKIEEIDSFLDGYGFKRVETKITEYEWGDAFYVKENKIRTKTR
jgi:FkbM family methyltransferase